MSRLAAPTRARASVSGSPSDAVPLRRQLTWVTVAWLFGSYWSGTITGAAMTQFARSLNTPDAGFGILGALPFLGALMQIPASYMLERYGRRKLTYLIAGCIGRLMWTLTAAIPWIMPGAAEWWWPAMLLAILVSWAAAHAATPAWMSWMSDLIPRRLRGRYFAVRNLASQPIALLVTVGVGYALDRTELLTQDHPDLMLKVTAAILAVAGLVGTLDILCFCFVRDNGPPPAQPSTSDVLRRMWAPMRDANFRKYLSFNFVFVLGTGFVGQYVWLYLFDVVGWSNWKANLLLLGVPLVIRMVCYRMWGRMADRLGNKPVLLITGAITALGSVGWMLITPERFWAGYLLVAFVTFGWPGLEIASFNYILNLAGSGREGSAARQATAGSAYVALNSTIVAVAGILSGVFGSIIASGFADLYYPLPWLDTVLTYHGVLFLTSTVLRVLAMTWVVTLVEPEASGTRHAIRYMTTWFYSNARQAMLIPTRVIGRVARWGSRASTSHR